MSVRKGSYVIAGTPRTTGGVEIGDMGFAPLGIDESLNLRRYLNGQVISQTQFVSFTNKVKSAVALFPSLATTEENWQSEKALSKFGQVGKFVIDDTAQTIRLPSVVNPQGLLGLSGIGNLVNESLPNIKGLLIGENEGLQGCFNTTTTDSSKNALTSDSSSPARGEIQFNASRSSSTYQNNAPVQQEAVQYPYYIQVATGVEETLPAIREYNINTPFFFGQSMYSDVAPDNASWLASNGQYNARAVYPDYYDWLNGKIGQVVTANGGKVALSTDTYTDYDFVVNQNDQTFRLPLLNGEEDLSGTTSENIPITPSVMTYTASKNGFVVGRQYSLTEAGFVGIGKLSTSEQQTRVNSGAGIASVVNLFLRRNETATIEYLNLFSLVFIPAVGSGTLYYYVGDTVQDASLINAGAVLNEVASLKANKADIDASNFNADGKSLLSGLGMPSGRYIDLTLGASGSTYTAPANGYFSIYVDKGDSTQAVVRLENGSIMHQDTRGYGSTSNLPLYSYIPVYKGQSVRCIHTYNGTFHWFRFIYAEGEN